MAMTAANAASHVPVDEFVAAARRARNGSHADPIPMTVSLVIPAKNEARNVAWVLRRLPSVVDEVILVDGHSTDDTVEVARTVRPDVVVVAEQGRGKGAALRTGFAAATGDIIVMIDADGSMDPHEIDRFVELLRDGHDLVKGSRWMPDAGSDDITVLRQLGNRFFCTMVNTLYGARFTDLCYGYVGFRRSALPRMALRADGFEIETEIVVRALKAGLRVGEVPSFESPRRYGESNLNTFRDGLRVLRKLLVERVTRAPGRQIDGLADGGSVLVESAGNVVALANAAEEV